MSDLDTDDDPESLSQARDGLTDLAAAVDRRERDLAAERPHRPSIDLRLAALFLLFLTVVLGLVAGGLIGVAILGLHQGSIIAEWAIIPTGPWTHQYTVGGPVAELAFAAVVAYLATRTNTVRKRLLQRKSCST